MTKTQEQALIRQALNECAGGMACQHTITERREMADIVRKLDAEATPLRYRCDEHSFADLSAPCSLSHSR